MIIERMGPAALEYTGKGRTRSRDVGGGGAGAEKQVGAGLRCRGLLSS